MYEVYFLNGLQYSSYCFNSIFLSSEHENWSNITIQQVNLKTSSGEILKMPQGSCALQSSAGRYIQATVWLTKHLRHLGRKRGKHSWTWTKPPTLLVNQHSEKTLRFTLVYFILSGTRYMGFPYVHWNMFFLLYSFHMLISSEDPFRMHSLTIEVMEDRNSLFCAKRVPQFIWS